MPAVNWKNSVISPLVQQDLIALLWEENDSRTPALLTSFSQNRFFSNCTPCAKVWLLHISKGEYYHSSKGSCGKSLWMVKQRSFETWFYWHIIGTKPFYNASRSILCWLCFMSITAQAKTLRSATIKYIIRAKVHQIAPNNKFSVSSFQSKKFCHWNTWHVDNYLMSDSNNRDLHYRHYRLFAL